MVGMKSVISALEYLEGLCPPLLDAPYDEGRGDTVLRVHEECRRAFQSLLARNPDYGLSNDAWYVLRDRLRWAARMARWMKDSPVLNALKEDALQDLNPLLLWLVWDGYDSWEGGNRWEDGRANYY